MLLVTDSVLQEMLSADPDFFSWIVSLAGVLFMLIVISSSWLNRDTSMLHDRMPWLSLG